MPMVSTPTAFLSLIAASSRQLRDERLRIRRGPGVVVALAEIEFPAGIAHGHFTAGLHRLAVECDAPFLQVDNEPVITPVFKTALVEAIDALLKIVFGEGVLEVGRPDRPRPLPVEAALAALTKLREENAA